MRQPFHIGQQVTYIPTGEIGIVKHLSETPGFVYVVYSCGGDWLNYDKYTAALTSCNNLCPGWPDDSKKR